MYIVNNYTLAVIFCVVTMICWGSWGNTQKLAAKTWRYEYFYWDYVIGLLLFSILSAFTLGSVGSEGRSFLPDLAQADWSNIGSALLGGVVFRYSSFAATVGTDRIQSLFWFCVALVAVNVLVNYFGAAKGAPLFIFIGVALIVVAIVLNGLAYRKMLTGSKKVPTKGIGISIAAGVIMAFFYRFVAAAMDLDNFSDPTPGMMTPYSALFVFSVGVLLSNFVFNTWVMRHPFDGAPVSYKAYFSGSLSTHLVGVLGGAVWALGTAFSYIAAGKAGAAVSYALGQGAPMIAAIWGVFIWREFRGAGRSVKGLLACMFLLFIGRLALIIISGAN